MTDEHICAHHRHRHPEELRFDQILVRHAERWKTSSASGNEWRFSVEIELYRRGRLLYHLSSRDQGEALLELARIPYLGPATLELEGWEPVWKNDGQGDPWAYRAEWRQCCQPGCSRPASVRYRVLGHFDKTCSMRGDAEPGDFREFCRAHKRRGDCGLNDGSTNYEPGYYLEDQETFHIKQEGHLIGSEVPVSELPVEFRMHMEGHLKGEEILANINMSRRMVAEAEAAGQAVPASRHWLDGVAVPGSSMAQILDSLEELVKPDGRPLASRGRICPACGQESENLGNFLRVEGGGVCGCGHCAGGVH